MVKTMAAIVPGALYAGMQSNRPVRQLSDPIEVSP